MDILKEVFEGVLYFGIGDNWKALIMYLIGGILIYLAIKKNYEPALLLPIGFGAILVNLPFNIVGVVTDLVGGEMVPSEDGAIGFLEVLRNYFRSSSSSRSEQ